MVGLGELAGEASYDVGGNARRACDPLGGERLGQRHDLVETGDRLPAADRAELAQLAEDREEERGVGSGPDRHPLRGLRRGSGAARVDHDDPAPAVADRGQSAHDVGRGEHRALAGCGIGADHDQVVGAVEVGDGGVPHAAEELGAHEVQGPLVDGGGGVVGAHAHGLAHADQGADVAGQSEVVCDRVADVDGEAGAPSVSRTGRSTRSHARQASSHETSRCTPSSPRTSGTAQPVGVLVQRPERSALGAEVAARPDVVLVAGDPDDAVAIGRHAEAAHGLAERAGHPVLARVRGRRGAWHVAS